MEELIRNKAKELFCSFGLKSVSMDDVARQCGVSKKTLYQHFGDRQALLASIVDSLLAEHAQAALQCRNKAQNAVQELALLLQGPFALLASVNGSFFYELEKFIPQAWEQLRRYRSEEIEPGVRRNLERGIAEGYYRPGLSLPVTIAIRMQQLRTALQPTNWPARTDAATLMKEFTIFYLNAVANEKGRKLIPKYFNTNDEQKKK
jgi:AcrR family transcriptional regulator